MILRTLGGLTLEGASFGRPKPLLLLVYLAMEGPTERRYLAELFWRNAANARGSLATALSQLRSGAPGVVAADGVRVSGDVQSDAVQFLGAVSEQDWLRATELYHGPFLEGVDLRGESVELEEWLYGTREFLADSMRMALLALGEQAAAYERFAEAGTWAARAYEIGAAVPAGPQDLVRLHALLLASNNPHARSLRSEASALGVVLPLTAEEARANFRDRPPAVPAHRLPSRTTTFVGRSKELEELEVLMFASDSRLLSLIGAGGSGKTRLSLHLAAGQAESDRWSGVYFVALETLEHVGQVMPAMAEAFGCRLQEDKDPVSQLSEFIGGSAPLVVLDNFEHLLSAAPMLSELVRACPSLQLLVTSRTRLNLSEEHAYLIEGLAVPSGRLESPEQAIGFEAVSLFVDRARRVRSDFSIGEDTAKAVVRICELVGGMPLALEMAAAWVRLMRCDEIAEELEQGLHLLDSPAGDRPDRHQSVLIAFEHSWALLTPSEQKMMHRVSVFRGGFAREAAFRVAGASLARLRTLIDASLITWDGMGRYDLHPLLHQYVEEKARCLPDEWADTRARHARHYLKRVGALQDAFPTDDARSAAAEIGIDLANVLAAWKWAARRGRHDLLTEAINPIGWFFSIRGLFEQGLAWSDIDTTAQPISLLAVRQCQWQAVFLHHLGRLEQAMAHNDRAIRVAEKVGAEADRDLVGALRLRGGMQRRIAPRDDAAAASTYRRAFALYEELGNAGGAAVMLNSLASLAGTREESQNMMRESLRLARDSGNVHAIGTALTSLALNYRLGTGDYDAARAAGEESLDKHEASGFTLQICTALLNLGEVHLALGDISASKAMAARTLGHCDALQGGIEAGLRAQAHALMGHAEMVSGDLEPATENYRRALGLLDSKGGITNTVVTACAIWNGLGRIALTRNRPEEAMAHAQEALELLPSSEVLTRSFLLGGRLRSLIHLGEALTIECEHGRAEEQLEEALRLAWEAELVPVTLEALMALAVLRQQQGFGGTADRVYSFLAGNSASTFELKIRLNDFLGDSPPPVPSPSIEIPGLAEMYSLAMHGQRTR